MSETFYYPATSTVVATTVTATTFSGSGASLTSLPMGQASGTLAIANGGTGLTSFTSGGLLYASSTSVLASSAPYIAGQVLYGSGPGAAPVSSSGLFWDSGNSRLGIGKTNPGTALDVNGTVTASTFYGALAGSNTGTFSNIYSANALTTTNLFANTLTASGQVQSLDSLRAHALPSDAMILASATQVNPTNQNTGSYALVESANALALTTTGSVPVVTQSPFADLYKEGSVYFNGTVGNYITTTATGYIGTAWGTAGMTIEAWVNYPTFTNAALASGGSPVSVQIPTLFGCVQPAGASGSIAFGSNVTGYTTFFYNANAGGLQSVTAQTPLSANTWNHIAITCSTSSQIFLFVNGVQSQIVANRNGTLQTAAYFETIQSSGGGASGNNPAIGQFNSTPVTAYLADLRITTGTPVYTGSTSSFATFTVPSAPLSTAATGVTQALIRAGQNSPTIQNGALTFDRGLKQFAQFGPQTFNIATRGFTAVFRYTWNGTVGNYERIFDIGVAGASPSYSYAVGFARAGTGNQYYFYVNAPPPASTNPQATTAAGVMNQGTSYVVACRWNPATSLADIWINGNFNCQSSQTPSPALADFTSSWTALGTEISKTYWASASMNTFAIYNRALSNVEIYNSYLALNTVPATPQQKTLEIGDINGTPALSVAGNGQVSVQSIGLSSNVVPWPPAAMTGYDTVINGGVYKARASREFSSAAGPAWIVFNKASSAYWQAFDGYSTTSPYPYTGPVTTTDVNGTSYAGDWLQIQLPVSVTPSTYVFQAYGGGFSFTTWVVLGSRDGINWSLVNKQTGVTWVGSAPAAAQTFSVTATTQSYNYYRLIGLNGSGTTVPAVYAWTLYGTADASPALTIAPATTFNTSVATPSLTGIAASGVYVPQDFSTSGLNIPAYVVSNTATVANTVAYSNFGPFAGEGSLYFPGGTGSYVNFPSTAVTLWQGGSTSLVDGTVEAWVYLTQYNTNTFIFMRNPSASSSSIDWYFNINNVGNLMFLFNSVSSGFYAQGGTVPLNTWTHIAGSLASNIPRAFINGALVGTGSTYSGTLNGSSSDPIFMSNYTLSGTQNIKGGYVACARAVAGLALYTTTFTPPTGPLQPIQGTTQAGLPYGTVLLLRNAPAPGRIQTTRLTGSNSGSVLSFPPAAMTGYSTLLNPGYGQGTYVASASSEYSSGTPVWYAFTKSTSSGSPWASGATFSGSTPYASTATTTVDISGNSYQGEWIQIQQPSSIVLSSYSIINYIGDSSKGPGKWALLGSRDGANWFLLDSRSGVPWSSSTLTYTVSSGQAFTYLRLIVNQLTGGGTVVQMSGLIFNGSIEGLNINPDGKIGIGLANPTRALEVAGDVVCAGTLSAGNPLMFRNAIINGGMAINQRGISTNWASPTAIGTSITTYATDRWNIFRGAGQTGSAVTQGALAAADAPYLLGLRNFLRVGRVSGDTGTQSVVCAHQLESRESWRFVGQPATFSFWYRTGSGFNGTLQINYFSGTGTDEAWRNGVTGAYTISQQTFASSNAWQFASVTGFVPSTANQVFAGFFYNATGTAGGFDYFDVTGVQLEKGLVATPFEVRPYATELALCQRYYYATSPGTPTGGSVGTVGDVCFNSGGTFNTGIRLPVPMRIAAWTLAIYNNGVANQFRNSSTGGVVTHTGTLIIYGNQSTTGAAGFYYTSGTELAVGTRYDFDYVVNAEL